MNAKRLFFVMIVVLFLGFTASAGLFYYTDDQLAESGKKLDVNDAHLAAAESNLSYLQSLEKRTTETKSLIGDIDNIFPKQKNQVQFIDQIKKLAEENNIDIGDQFNFPSSQDVPSGLSQITPSTSVTGLVGMELDVSFNGSYENSMNFIEDLENFRRLVNIEKLNLQSSNKGEDLNGTITLLVLVDAALQSPKTDTDAGGAAPANSGAQDNSTSEGSAL